MNEVGIRTIETQPTIAVRLETTQAALKDVFDTELPRVAAAMEDVGAIMVGPPFARYRAFGPDRVDVEIGAAIAAVPPGLAPISDVPYGIIGASSLPAGEVAATVHEGPFDGLEATYDALAAWIVEQGRVAGAGPWEVYLTDPQRVPDPADWLTEVVWPLDG